MKRQSTLALTLALLLGGPGVLPAQEKLKESEYYPLKVGTTWHYRAGGGKLTVRVARNEKVGDVLCALVEAVVEGEVKCSEHIAVHGDGLYRHALNGQRVEPPLRFLKLPPRGGESWAAESKVAGMSLKVSFTAGAEEVEVPAGKYQTAVVRTSDVEVSDLKFTTGVWYARGVGMVKTVLSAGENDVVLELEKFEAGK